MLGCWLAALSQALSAQQVAAARPGIEVVVSDSLHLVQGRRVALLSNAAATDRQGRPSVQVLREAGVTLVALFSPEHGFSGTAAPGEKVESSTDPATSLPIYSLYGRSLAPTAAMLAGVEVLLVDLPDAGARYFTWIGSVIEVMKAAGQHGVRVMVLDRPNPIGGTIEGNVLDPAHRSLIGSLAVPMRHGLTLGELALLARADLGLAVDLAVVPVSGWRREVPLDLTGLPFRPPSPNLRDLEALYHYPGTCLFEGTNLSVGRGSDHPFHQVGAPWLAAPAIVAALGPTAIPGVRLEVTSFTPRRPGDAKYADTTVAGIRLVVTDPAAYRPVHTALTLLAAIQRQHPGEFRFLPAHFDLLAGGPRLREGVVRGETPEGMAESWGPEVARFMARSAPVRLYP